MNNNILPILNKEQFKRLCEHHRLVRILTDGKTLYAWNAEEAEHKEIRAKLHLSDEFIGFLFEKGVLYSSINAVGSQNIKEKLIKNWLS